MPPDGVRDGGVDVAEAAVEAVAGVYGAAAAQGVEAVDDLGGEQGGGSGGAAHLGRGVVGDRFVALDEAVDVARGFEQEGAGGAQSALGLTDGAVDAVAFEQAGAAQRWRA